MKEWFSAQELADMKLPNLPTAKKNIIDTAARENWKSRPRSGRGGGKEYHISNLPEIARIQLAVMTAPAVGTAVAGRKEKEKAENLKGLAEYAHLDGSAKVRVDAKLEILEAFEAFKQQLGYKTTRARFLFAENYNIGKIEVADWVRNAVTSVCPASLRNWGEVLENKGLSGLAGEYGKRRGAGIIDSNEEMKTLVLGMLYKTPHVSCSMIKEAIKGRFKSEECPSYRTIQAWIKRWKSENKQLFLYVKNPDAWKSKFKSASGDASENILRLNQEWQFDGTPSDLMLNDGRRYNIVGIIDVWSRRLSLYVSNKATSFAVGCATRKAILNWGVPETARTDNGKDYVARYIKRFFKSMGIQQILCPPFGPEKKPHIERVFKTFSHGLLELLEGYVGHNIIDRKDIEARRSFAKRLFVEEQEIKMNLSPEELQKFCDDWCQNVYGTALHTGIGMAPREKAASYTGEIRKIPDVRALDMLLCKPVGNDGIRTVVKKGIPVDNKYYTAVELAGYEGRQVRVLYDENEYGIVYVYDLDGTFIAQAISVDNLGVTRAEVAAARIRKQKSIMAKGQKLLKQMAKAAKADDIVAQIMRNKAEDAGKLTFIPQYRAVDYETRGMAEALKAVVQEKKPRELTDAERQIAEEMKAKTASLSNVAKIPESPRQRFKKWHELRDRIKAGEIVSENEFNWFEGYPSTDEFKAQKKAYEQQELLAAGQ